MRSRMKFSLVFFLALLMVFSLSAKGQDEGAAQEEKVIKFSHVTSPETARHQAALKFKEIVEEKTGGTIKVEVYSGGQLGGDRDAIEGVRIGTIQMTVAGAGIFASFEPKMGITALPFLFENFEAAWAFNDSDVNAEVSDLLVNQGMRVLAFWENGFRCLTNSVRAVNSPADVKGLNIRTPQNPIILATMRSLGANPSPLPWPELYMALQQKSFDGQENPIPLIYNAKVYEVQKYLAITNHVYEPMPLVINEKFWQSLTSKQRKIVAAAIEEAKEYDRQLIKQQTDEMLEKLGQAGMIITTPDLAPFKEASKDVKNEFLDQFGAELIEAAYNFGK